ncbi:MAG TPA: hypothetical protein VKA51_00755 [Rubrobacteraceae bacterium]|nr:hypothetical protein [Rubrobacteraceae bacterium]
MGHEDAHEGMDPLERKYVEAVVNEHLNEMMEDMEITPKLALYLMQLEARTKRIEQQLGIDDLDSG